MQNEFKALTVSYIHKKTGNKYSVISAAALDCTNSRDGLAVVVYTDNCGHIYVRELVEFTQKFDRDYSDETAMSEGTND